MLRCHYVEVAKPTSVITFPLSRLLTTSYSAATIAAKTAIITVAKARCCLLPLLFTATITTMTIIMAHQDRRHYHNGRNSCYRENRSLLTKQQTDKSDNKRQMVIVFQKCSV